MEKSESCDVIKGNGLQRSTDNLVTDFVPIEAHPQDSRYFIRGAMESSNSFINVSRCIPRGSDTTEKIDRGGRNVTCYRKKAHPRHKGEPQEWEQTDKADCLNIFDNTETRTPIIIVTD